MFGDKSDRETLELIEDRALSLLLEEPEEDRAWLLRQAEKAMFNVGLCVQVTSDDPHQGCHDLIGSNLFLPDWMRARYLDPANVLNAEDFQDLIDRLTPGYWDETPA